MSFASALVNIAAAPWRQFRSDGMDGVPRRPTDPRSAANRCVVIAIT